MGEDHDDEDALGAGVQQLIVQGDPAVTATDFAVQVDVSNQSATENAFFQAFIDFNRDGDFDDPGEGSRPAVNLGEGETIIAPGTNAGTVTAFFRVPAGANTVDFGSTFMRIVVSDTNDIDTQGTAGSGEIEDHLVVVGQSFSCDATTNYAGLDFSDRNTTNLTTTGGFIRYNTVGFSNNGTPVDAILTINSMTGGTINTGQSGSGADETPPQQFDPDTALLVTNVAIGNTAVADVTLSFVEAGTNTPVTMDVVLATGDLDRAPAPPALNAREESIILDVAALNDYGLDPNTNLVIADDGTSISFTGTAIQAGEAESYVVYGFNPASSFNITLVNESLPGATSPSAAGFVFDGSLSELNIGAPACNPVDNADFGDAPDTGAGTGVGNYQTTAADDGPNHLIVAGAPQVGTNATDGEDGTFQNAAADGDDAAGTNDEDAAVPAQFFAATPYSFDIAGSGSGFLNVWIDWNRDGDFDDTGEFVADDQVLAATNTISGTAPAEPTAVLGDTIVRIRVCDAADLCDRSFGTAPNGEVEDHLVTIEAAALDFGDAPTSGNPFGDTLPGTYPDASAIVSTQVFLGANAPDAETATQSSPTAGRDGTDGDDGNGTNDEDGISPAVGQIVIADPGASQLVEVPVFVNNTTAAPAEVQGFIDLNRDGDFNDAGEQSAVLTVAVGAAGPIDLQFNATAGAELGATFLRVVIFDTPGSISATGTTGSGEVEDHLVVLGQFFACDASTAFADLDFSDIQSRSIAGGNGSGSSVLFNNVGFSIDGRPVDARMTLVTLTNGTLLAPEFGNGTVASVPRPPENALVVIEADEGQRATADVRFEFFDALTGAPADINALFAIGDLDEAIRPLGPDNRTEGLQLSGNDLVGYGRNDPTNLLVTGPGQGSGSVGAGDIIFTGTEIESGGPESFAIFGYRPSNTIEVTLVNQSIPDLSTGRDFAAYEIDGTLAEFNFTDVECAPTEADFGDAPDTLNGGYPTLSADNGPFHVFVSGDPRIGPNAPDSEADGQPNPTATGDDGDGNNDEDTNVPDQLVIGQPFSFDIQGGGGGFFSVWIDWNRDGDFDDANERVVDDQGLGGTNTIAGIAPPLGTNPGESVVGDTIARFRACDAVDTCDLPIGGASNGEIEDHPIELIEPLDFGDAPTGGTVVDGVARNYGEAAQVTLGDLRLGGTRDIDLDATTNLPANQPSPDAQGDDTDTGVNGGDDEDGVRLNGVDLQGQELALDTDYVLQVSVLNGGVLNAWIDLDRSGTFDGGERFATDLTVLNGSNIVGLSIPQSTDPTDLGDTFVRFRICSAAGECNTPTGVGAGPDAYGEVEDYLVTIIEPNVRIQGRVFEDNGGLTANLDAHDGAFQTGDETGLGGITVVAFNDANGDGVLNGGETVFDTTATAGDGTYALTLDDSVFDPTPTPVTISVDIAGAEWLHISDFETTLQGSDPDQFTDPGDPSVNDNFAASLINGSQQDGVIVFQPAIGGSYLNLDFGQIRQPTLTIDQNQVTTPGGVVVFPHEYTATTNGDVVFGIGLPTDTPDGTFTDPEIFIDANNDGQIDAGEALTNPVSVTAGEVVNLLVRTQALNTAPIGAELSFDVVALTDFVDQDVTLIDDDDTTLTGPGDYLLNGNEETCEAVIADLLPIAGFGDVDHCITNTDTVLASEPVALDLVKEQALDADCNGAPDGGPVNYSTTQQQASVGTCVIYRITATNTASSTATNVEISDVTPAFTTFENVGAAVTSPNIAGSVVPNVLPPAPIQGQVGSIASTGQIGDLDPGEVATMTFVVEVSTGTGNPLAGQPTPF